MYRLEKRKIIGASVFVLGLMGGGVATAEADMVASSDRDVVVTATGYEQKLIDAPASAPSAFAAWGRNIRFC